jgi:hypothetical protein
VFTQLLGLDYRIVYKKGIENVVVDGLLRRPIAQEQSCAISIYKPKWLDQVVSSYEQDSAVQDMIAKLAIDAEAIPNFTWTNGLLRYKGMIWIGSNQVLQLKVIAAMHDSALGSLWCASNIQEAQATFCMEWHEGYCH